MDMRTPPVGISNQTTVFHPALTPGLVHLPAAIDAAGPPPTLPCGMPQASRFGTVQAGLQRFGGPGQSACVNLSALVYTGNSAGFTGTPTQWLIGAGLIVVVVAAAALRRSTQGRRLAQEYFGQEFVAAEKTLATCKRGDRGWARDDIKLLKRAALTVDRIIRMPIEQHAGVIDHLIHRWRESAPASCYAVQFDAGVPARALKVLAHRIPESFTRAHYVVLANVGRNGTIPMFGRHLMDAADLLRGRFGELLDGEIVTREQEHTAVVAETLRTLEATGGVPEDVKHALDGGTGLVGLGGILAALVLRGEEIKEGLGTQVTGLIRSGKDRVKDFTDARDPVKGLDEDRKQAIYARQAEEMVAAVLARATSLEGGREAVGLLLKELAHIYPGASNIMSGWLIVPMLYALETLARDHPTFFYRSCIEELRELRRIGGVSKSFTNRLDRILQLIPEAA